MYYIKNIKGKFVPFLKGKRIFKGYYMYEPLESEFHPSSFRARYSTSEFNTRKEAENVAKKFMRKMHKR